MTLRIALVVSHPIQHFCPQYVSFAQNDHIVFKVFFASRLGLHKYHDPNFQTEISWGNLNLDCFDHVFLNGDQVLPSDKDLDALTLGEELHKFGPQLIIIYGYFQKLQRRAYQWAINNKVQLAYVSDSELRHKRSAIKRFFQYFYLRLFFGKINYFLSVGNANEEFYRRHHVNSHKIVRMHFPIDIKAYANALEHKSDLNEKVRNRYGIEKDAIVLSVVGKLVTWKNQDHIFDAMIYLENEGYFVHLFVIGSGPMLNEWKEKSKALKRSKVHFTGFVTIDELPSFYATSDIYVHPAAIEPHSIAISEAIYLGCPIVLSNTCGSYGFSDDVQPDINGFVFKFGDTMELADRLKLLLTDSELRHRFSLNSIHIGKKNQIQSHVGILSDLINRIESEQQ